MVNVSALVDIRQLCFCGHKQDSRPFQNMTKMKKNGLIILKPKQNSQRKYFFSSRKSLYGLFVAKAKSRKNPHCFALEKPCTACLLGGCHAARRRTHPSTSPPPSSSPPTGAAMASQGSAVQESKIFFSLLFFGISNLVLTKKIKFYDKKKT